MKLRKGYGINTKLDTYGCACGSHDHSVILQTFPIEEGEDMYDELSSQLGYWSQPMWLNEGWWDRIKCAFRYIFLGEDWNLGTWSLSDQDQKRMIESLKSMEDSYLDAFYKKANG